MKALTEKQLNNRLNKYYLKHFGEKDADEFYVNPAINKWKFKRDGKIILLVCDMESGKVEEKIGMDWGV